MLPSLQKEIIMFKIKKLASKPINTFNFEKWWKEYYLQPSNLGDSKRTAKDAWNAALQEFENLLLKNWTERK